MTNETSFTPELKRRVLPHEVVPNRAVPVVFDPIWSVSNTGVWQWNTVHLTLQRDSSPPDIHTLHRHPPKAFVYRLRIANLFHYFWFSWMFRTDHFQAFTVEIVRSIVGIAEEPFDIRSHTRSIRDLTFELNDWNSSRWLQVSLSLTRMKHLSMWRG